MYEHDREFAMTASLCPVICFFIHLHEVSKKNKIFLMQQMFYCDKDHGSCLGFEIFLHFTSWETQTADSLPHFTQKRNVRAANINFT